MYLLAFAEFYLYLSKSLEFSNGLEDFLPRKINCTVQGAQHTFPRLCLCYNTKLRQLLVVFDDSDIQACLSVAYLSPQYHGLVYGDPVEVSVHVMEGEGWGPKVESLNRTTVKVFGTEKMTWQGECFLMTGVLGFALVSLLAVSSLPSVTANLTWKEFAFIQSGLGWLAMILLCGHDMFYGWKYMDGPSCGIPSSFQVGLTLIISDIAGLRFYYFSMFFTFLA